MVDMPTRETGALLNFLKQEDPESVLRSENNVYVPSQFDSPQSLNVHEFVECSMLCLPVRQLSELGRAIVVAETLIVERKPEGCEDMLAVLLMYKEVFKSARRRKLMFWCSY